MSDLEESDFRQNNPRFARKNLAANRDRFAALMALAEALNVTPAQRALAWLLHQGDDIVPIPGTRRLERVDENVQAAKIILDRTMLERIDDMAPPGLAEGATFM